MTHSGKEIEAKIGGMAPVFVSGNYAWNMEENADELDGTTGEDAGYENPSVGVYSGVVMLKGYMDIVSGTYTPIRRGTTISNLKLYRDKDDTNPAFSIPSAVVLQSTQGGEVRGKVEWTARIKTKGSYTYNEPS